ncbi:MAG: alkylphosphonate utilization protein [Bacteroidetes bacterium]|nr:MAG: alkylphosphonate utilization protein [Bacteroidota bacterium]
MSDQLNCPQCNYEYTYPDGDKQVCPDCGHEWNPNEASAEQMEESSEDVVLDSNGNALQNGDTVIVIKDLPVKGAPKPVKAGTKVKNIRLTNGDHNIDCKIDGFGAMGLKSEFVKKA